MKQPESIQLGEIGETNVFQFFQLLNWGPITTGKHDLGTDLFVQVRTDDRVDLGTMLGVQVKTGHSFFTEPGELDGRSGWWFREPDKAHESYWSNHHVPHIIVLVSEDLQNRFWAYVNRKTIDSTGAGIKVFIPKDQPLTGDFAPGWRDAAAEARKKVSFEGSRWNFDMSDVRPDDVLRYALVVPRLLAPHPNRGVSLPLVWHQAVALCVSGEAERWVHFSERNPSVPLPEKAGTSHEWGWRFAAAIYQWIELENGDPLRDLDMTGCSNSELIAHAVVTSFALIDSDRLGEAMKLLELHSNMDVFSVDQGWIGIQRGRLLVEIGERPAGLKVLARANVQLAAADPDVAASAIQAAAVWSLFTSEDRRELNLDSLIPALDTTAGWWRAQNTATGLEQIFDESYKNWAGSEEVEIRSSAPGRNSLLASTLIARLTGAHDQWRRSADLLGRAGLMSGFTPPARALNDLRRAGANKSLVGAIRRLRAEGPPGVVTELVSRVAVGGFTRTTLEADLILGTAPGFVDSLT